MLCEFFIPDIRFLISHLIQILSAVIDSVGVLLAFASKCFSLKCTCMYGVFLRENRGGEELIVCFEMDRWLLLRLWSFYSSVVCVPALQ